MTVQHVILASPRGFCAGVDRAIEIVRMALDAYGPPVYVFHEIVHNPYVVQDLRRKGAIFVNDLSEAPQGARTVYSAHGVSPEVRAQANRQSLRIIDATCPLVTKVHLEAVRFAKEGYFNILVGHKGHDEVIGTMGEAQESTVLVSTVEEAESVTVPDPERVAILTQTTLSVDDTRDIIETLRRRFPALRFPPKDDICYATQNRQSAVKALAAQVDLVLVLGASNSSNSQRLREVAQQSRVPAHRINDISALRSEWLESVQTVGITSGASTPEFLVQQAIDYFVARGATDVHLLETVEERVHFALPRELHATP